jgi:hypothetical protein
MNDFIQNAGMVLEILTCLAVIGWYLDVTDKDKHKKEK